MSRLFGVVMLAGALGAAVASCDDDTSPADAGGLDMSAKTDGSTDLGPAGMAQACTGQFIADNHCDAMGDMGAISQTTSQASCHPSTDGGAVMTDYGTTMCGQMGKDDDCKYIVSWTSTPIYQNTSVDFTVNLQPNATGNQVTGAQPVIEAFLNDTHPAPASGSSTELGNGMYKISGVRFDAPGMWTVRFHFFEDCSDLLDSSPHGHAAFYVNVP